jgi:hypothetical protein
MLSTKPKLLVGTLMGVLAACTSSSQPQGIALVSSSAGSGLSYSRALSASQTVSIELGATDSADVKVDFGYGSINLSDREVDYRRVEVRQWINPNARMEPYFGVAWSYYGQPNSSLGSAHNLGASVGAAYWLTPALTFDLGYYADLLELAEDGTEYDMDGIRFAFSYWF